MLKGMVYHILTSAEWERARSNSTYTPPTFEQERFIHLCDEDQIAGVIERYFPEPGRPCGAMHQARTSERGAALREPVRGRGTVPAPVRPTQPGCSPGGTANSKLGAMNPELYSR